MIAPVLGKTVTPEPPILADGVTQWQTHSSQASTLVITGAFPLAVSAAWPAGTAAQGKAGGTHMMREQKVLWVCASPRVKKLYLKGCVYRDMG